MKINSIFLSISLNFIAIALAAPTTRASQGINYAVEHTSNSLKARSLLDPVQRLLGALRSDALESPAPPDLPADSSGDFNDSGMAPKGNGLSSATNVDTFGSSYAGKSSGSTSGDSADSGDTGSGGFTGQT